jgi:hypothetical protein
MFCARAIAQLQRLLPELVVLLAFAHGSAALYGKSDDVVQLTGASFQTVVEASPGIAAVEFFAPCTF